VGDEDGAAGSGCVKQVRCALIHSSSGDAEVSSQVYELFNPASMFSGRTGQ
jgi:hypothetical protein